MKKLLMALVALSIGTATSVCAALKPGDKAPMFKLPAALGGKQFTFSLADALKTGPVVVYFYPKAFTSGCTAEAHAFAEAMDKFHALGASVIGISSDDIGTVSKFSSSECRNKFPVGADADQKVIGAYDTAMMGMLPYANRTSYVVTPDGHIAYEYTALDYSDHVANTLAAVKKWKDTHSATQ